MNAQYNQFENSFLTNLRHSSISHCIDNVDIKGKRNFLYIGPNSNNLVIFFHSAGSDLFYPNLQSFNYLLQSGYDILSFDIDGHGKNSDTVLEPTNFCLAEGELEKMVPDIRGYKKIICWSQSLGCYFFHASFDCISNLNPKITSVYVATPCTMPNIFDMAIEIGMLPIGNWGKIFSTYGLGGWLPAFYRFKEKSYPIRGKQGENARRDLSYVKAVESIIIGNRDRVLEGAQQLILGGIDRIAPKHHWDERLNNSHSRIQVKIFPYKNHFHIFASPTPIAWFVSGETQAAN